MAMNEKRGGIGVRVIKGVITVECMDAEGNLVLSLPTTARGLFKLSDMIGELACKLTGLKNSAEIDAYLAEGNETTDGKVEEHPLDFIPRPDFAQDHSSRGPAFAAPAVDMAGKEIPHPGGGIKLILFPLVSLN